MLNRGLKYANFKILNYSVGKKEIFLKLDLKERRDLQGCSS